MYTDSVLSQIETALGAAYPEPDAPLHKRIEFICQSIASLREKKRMPPDDWQERIEYAEDGRGDFSCGACLLPYPCGCECPTPICNICGGDVFDCNCTERSYRDLATS